MKKQVLVLGSSGLIGHQIYNFLKDTDKYTLHNLSHTRKLVDDTILMDARNENLFIKKVKEISPDYIINCIGILIDKSEKNPLDAIYLNAYLPHILKRSADSFGCKLIHISTDCVFSGLKKGPYSESDSKDAKDIYGRTKGLGEIISQNHLTLRTSVVGPEIKSDGEELFHWFMNQSNSIDGFTESIWSGVTTIELARAVDMSISLDISGIYHVTNNKQINKYELLKLFKKYTKKDIKILKVKGRSTDKSFIDTRRLLEYKIQSYEEMIRDMLTLMNHRKDLYSQYFID